VEEIIAFNGNHSKALEVSKFLQERNFVHGVDFTWYMVPRSGNSKFRVVANNSKLEEIRSALLAYKLGMF